MFTLSAASNSMLVSLVFFPSRGPQLSSRRDILNRTLRTDFTFITHSLLVSPATSIASNQTSKPEHLRAWTLLSPSNHVLQRVSNSDQHIYSHCLATPPTTNAPDERVKSMATDAMDEFFVYENRLASFTRPQAVAAKRRASGASTHSRAPKALSWPHKSIKPADVRLSFAVPGPQSCFILN